MFDEYLIRHKRGIFYKKSIETDGGIETAKEMEMESEKGTDKGVDESEKN